MKRDRLTVRQAMLKMTTD